MPKFAAAATLERKGERFYFISEETRRKFVAEQQAGGVSWLVEITGDHVSILTDLAIAAENVDEAKAEEARQRAAARLRERSQE